MGKSADKQDKFGIFFEIEYMFATVKGRFAEYQSKIYFNDKKLDLSFVKVVVDTASVDINSNLMEELVMSKDFFNSSEHPHMIFSLQTIKKKDKEYKATGNLEIKGVIKDLEIPFKVSQNSKGNRILKSSFLIDRTEYNIGESMLLLKSEVKIKLRVKL